MLWNGEDLVYERIGEGYVLMTADRKGTLEAEYVRNGRTISSGFDLTPGAGQ